MSLFCWKKEGDIENKIRKDSVYFEKKMYFVIGDAISYYYGNNMSVASDC